MDSTAIKAIQEAHVSEGLNEQLAQQLNGYGNVIAMPDTFSMHDLERYQPERRRFVGTVSTKSLTSFATYINTNGDPEEAAIFINQDKMSAQAVLDLGSPGKPLHGDHRANLTLEKTAPFKSLSLVDGHVMSQRDMAEWFEDWNLLLYANDDDGNPLPIKKVIAAIRRVSVARKKDTETSDERYSKARGTMESVEVKGDGLPATLSFNCLPYADLEERAFPLRMSYVERNDEPLFKVGIIGLESISEAMGFEFATLLADKLNSKLPVYLGTFSG